MKDKILNSTKKIKITSSNTKPFREINHHVSYNERDMQRMQEARGIVSLKTKIVS